MYMVDSEPNPVSFQPAVQTGLRNVKRDAAAPFPVMTGHTLSLEPEESAMVKFVDGECDADSINPLPPPKKPKHEDKDTNVLMIKFGALSKPCKVHTGDPVVCSNDQCAAILNYHSKVTKETEREGNVSACAKFRLKLADDVYT